MVIGNELGMIEEGPRTDSLENIGHNAQVNECEVVDAWVTHGICSVGAGMKDRGGRLWGK